MSLDANGDGVADVQSSTVEGLGYTYSSAGLYTPTATVSFENGTSRTIATIVRVWDADVLDSILQTKWQRLKDAIRNADLDRALENVIARKRQSYRRMLDGLGANAANIDQILGDITFVRQQGGRAEYEMIRIQDGLRMSYLVLFGIDEDGVWRLKFF